MNLRTVQTLGPLISEIRTGPFGSTLHAHEYTRGGTPVVNPQHYRDGRIVPDEEVTVPMSVAERLEAFRLREGDVVVARRGEMGRCAVVRDREVGWILGTGSAALRPGPRLRSQYLAYFLRSPGCVRELMKESVGSTMANLNQKILLSLPCHAPPLPEQDRIVAAIESHFSRIDSAVATLQRVRANLRRARASVLKAAVEGRLVPLEATLARAEGRDYESGSALLARLHTERRAEWIAAGARSRYQEPTEPLADRLPTLPEGWAWCRIDTAGKVQLGRQRAPANHHGPNMRPYLRVANVYEARIDLEDVMEMNFTPEEYITFKLEPGDILLNEGQSPHLVGRPAMWSGQVASMCFTNSLVRFRAGPGVIPAYALHVFRAQLAARRYMKLVTITTNIAHLGAQRFAAVEFPLPPLAEQHRIVAEVDRRLSVLDALELSVDANIARCARLRQAILKRAFEGRLLPEGTSARLPTESSDTVEAQ